jgi:hypothetical protein
MDQFYKTPVAAERLGIRYSHLISLMRYGKVAAPQRDSSGDYIWTEDDLAAVRTALLNKRAPQKRA